MLDIALIRGHPEIVRESQLRRGADPAILELVIERDTAWREIQTTLNGLRQVRNRTTREISEMKGRGDDASLPISRMKAVSAEIRELEQQLGSMAEERDRALMSLPNILDPSVPPGRGGEDNVPVGFHGTARVPREFVPRFREDAGGVMDHVELAAPPLSHADITGMDRFADIPRAAKVAGSRFYYLKNQFVLLDLALQLYGLRFLNDRGFEVIQPPYMLNRQAMEGVTDLAAFQETLYRIEGEDLHLIATAEHPIGAMFMGEIFDHDAFPRKFAGVSPCFRKEAGAHGKDTKGIFRVHQFHKIEQFVFCHPEDSWPFFEELVTNSRDICGELDIPYRVMEICAGDMGSIASRKIDLECWMPASGQFREIVSVSNALDYQARRLNIRFRTPEGNVMVHTLNGTAIATSRMMVAIMENHQEDGIITIPPVLRTYTGFDTIDIREPAGAGTGQDGNGPPGE